MHAVEVARVIVSAVRQGKLASCETGVCSCGNICLGLSIGGIVGGSLHDYVLNRWRIRNERLAGAVLVGHADEELVAVLAVKGDKFSDACKEFALRHVVRLLASVIHNLFVAPGHSIG